jgi:hypothetical protein
MVPVLHLTVPHAVYHFQPKVPLWGSHGESELSATGNQSYEVYRFFCLFYSNFYTFIDFLVRALLILTITRAS